MQYLLESSFGFIINKTNTKLKNKLHHEFKPYGLTPEQWSLLNCLYTDTPVTPKEVSDRIFKDKPNTNRILDKLLIKKLVLKQPHPTDHRSFHIYLTEEGSLLRDKLIPIAKELILEATKGIDQKSIEEIKTLLDAIYDNLD